MYFVTWNELNGDPKVSPGCDAEQASLIQACKQHEGKLKVKVMSSGDSRYIDLHVDAWRPR